VLPKSLEEALTIAVHNRVAREELARTFTQCAEEGAQEIYRSLLPLIVIDGIDDLLMLLDQTIVPDLLFNHLRDTVDNAAYETQVKRLTRVLGRFSGAIIDRAAQCSLPLPEHSLRLRAAAVNILGGTRDARAVEPLIARLHDADQFIVERAANSLIRLGPELTLTHVLHELEDRTAKPFVLRIHHAALTVLREFVEERDIRRQVNFAQYLRILETIVPVLSTNYQAEPELQQLASSILVRQVRDTEGVGARDNRWEKVIVALLHYLPSQNDVTARNVIRVFQEIGSLAIPSLLAQLNQSSELVRIRIVEILQAIRDARALPPLLRLVADPSPAVQQQVASALRAYVPDSIPGLIDIVLESTSEDIADRAALILASIGEHAVEPIITILFQIVPGRTRLLVSVLEHIRDGRALPALITLLQTPQMEPLLVITIIRAISQFPDKRVVAPLIAMLTDTNPQFYEEAIDALSRLGPLALDSLVAALDAPQPAHIRQRIRRAILGMTPFPGDALIAALETSSDAQAQQILVVFKTQGNEAAQTLVRHLMHRDELVREYVIDTLSTMSGPIVVPALLDVLGQPETRRIVYALLLKYPDSAILPLVDLLREAERGEATTILLPLFGPAVLAPLVSAMDEPDSQARERARRIVIELVRRSTEHDDGADLQEVLRAIVGLFNPPPPARAREMLLSLLTEDLADKSIPALLEGLEDAYLIKDVSEAFAGLARRGMRDVVLDSLIDALHLEERRRGAATALAGLGAMAVLRVGELIASPQLPVAKAAQDVLRQIGAPALDFIWTAHSDKSNPQRRAAALAVFHSMRTEVIKDKLVTLLASNKPDEVAMAVALLLERIYDEATQHYADRVMIPELIEYMQTHTMGSINLRIIALLLLLVQYPRTDRKKGETSIIPVFAPQQQALYQRKPDMSGDFTLDESIIADHLIQALDDYPQHHKQLMYILLLLGTETEQMLLDVFNDPDTRMELRAELAAVLGMMTAPQVITEYAQNLSQYGVSGSKSSALFPAQLAIALRALGGLLASGYWDVHRLQELRDASKEGSPARELFNVLSGWRYEVQLAQLRSELRVEREARKQEVTTLMMQAVSAQQKINFLEGELHDIRREHTSKSDELDQTERDREQLRTNLDKVLQEKNAYSTSLDLVVNERDTLNIHLNQALQEKDALQAHNASLQAQLDDLLQENKKLYDQNQQLLRTHYQIP
jgi:HEAT repeat protein